MTWLDGRKWEWTDIRFCKGRFKPIVSERSLTVVNPFLQTLRTASVDSSPMVRKVAAEILIRNLKSLGDESLPLAKLLATDKSPSVAEWGQYALKRIEEEQAL